MSSGKLNVLFVDDEPKIVDGLRRQLRAQREKWEMRFVTSGEAALQAFKEQPADIIVSDMRMPGMNGGQLLSRVRELYPQTTRMILSGQTDQSDLLRELGSIHQYLQKPCDSVVLCQAIERTRILSSQLNQPALRLAASGLAALPPGSENYRALTEELGKEEASLPKIADLVASDPALAVKLIQLVNSAFFGLPRKVNSPREAVVLLGVKTVHGIVVAGRLFDFIGLSACDQSKISQIWKSSVEVGEAAASFAKQNGGGETVAACARLAGMLSLIGRAILVAATPQSYAEVIAGTNSGSVSYLESEKKVYGATQDDVGAYALGIWAFSDELVEAVACQSNPSVLPVGKTNDLVGYVHLARASHQGDGIDAAPKFDAEFFSARGMSSLVPQKLREAA